MVNRRDTSCQRHNRVSQRKRYASVDVNTSCHWHFTDSDVSPARNWVRVSRGDQQLRKNFEVRKYRCYDRYDELILMMILMSMILCFLCFALFTNSTVYPQILVGDWLKWLEIHVGDNTLRTTCSKTYVGHATVFRQAIITWKEC